MNPFSFFDDFEYGNPWPDLAVPFAFAGLLSVLNLLFPSVFFIGVPYDFAGDAVYGGLVAAPYEELGFRLILMGVTAPFLGPGSILLNALLFSSFHYLAYGIGLQAAFIGAFFVGLFASVWIYQRRSVWAIIGLIAMHGIFNVFLAAQDLIFLPIVPTGSV